MTKLIFYIDGADMPAVDTADTIHVLLYAPSPIRPETASIGGQLENAIKKLGVVISDHAFDFLSIALAVIAADTFVKREIFSANGWTREFILNIPVTLPKLWTSVKSDLEQALNFLSGDLWTLDFREGGKRPPSEEVVQRCRSHIAISSADCICLFSGGLDSLIGAYQLIEHDSRMPLLVSHSYRGDQSYQEYLAPQLNKSPPRFAANANPRLKRRRNQNDTTMRTRSFGFLAYGIVAANALSITKPSLANVDLFIPENGFIALNAPLTRRRIGSHSTRTTHPNFLSRIQSILNKVGFNVQIKNPYRHKTKGEMLSEIQPNRKLITLALATVSCGKWKRKSKQCGHCVPCLIRRSAFTKAGIKDTTAYQFPDLNELWKKPTLRDDLMAVMIAIERDEHGLKQRAIASGPLPFDEVERENWFGVHKRGLEEVATYLKNQKLGT